MFFDVEYLRALGLDPEAITENLSLTKAYRYGYIALTQDEYLLLKLATGIDPLNLKSNLNLTGAGIRELPDNLTISGSIDLKYSKVTLLPENLTIIGNLDIRCAKISFLPDSLTISDGYIYMYRSQMRVIPEKFAHLTRG